MTNTKNDTMYRVEVSRPDGLIIDTFYTGYPERDILTDKDTRENNSMYGILGVLMTYSVSVA